MWMSHLRFFLNCDLLFPKTPVSEGHPIHDTSKIGGRYVDKDKTWQDFFADFLLEKCLSDQFTWDLNPTSADTGGLLKDDWVTPEEGKLAVVACVQPDPSVLSQNAKNGRVCFSPGSYANAKCAPTQQRQRRRLSGRNIK